MDVLSDVLRAVRLSAAVYFDFRVSEPLSSQTPNMSHVGHQLLPNAAHVIPFHVILRGHCWVESTETKDPPLDFREGDIVIYPHGHAHAFSTHLGDRVPPNLDLYRQASGQTLPVLIDRSGLSNPTMRFVCGYLGCDLAPFNPLLEALPSQVVCRRPEDGHHIEVDLMQSALDESELQRPGGEAVLARLSELIFVRAIRRYIETLPGHANGWLAGLRDRQIGRALQLMHANPERDWTVEAIARECGMSRALLTEKFAKVVGHTPMRYLTRWRMQTASTLLAESDLPIETVAERVGYRSEASFNRAFKSIVGDPPGIWRRLASRSSL
ncbi:MAG: AraC family transcriptional regulator [Pseudomonadota bacterium]